MRTHEEWMRTHEATCAHMHVHAMNQNHPKHVPTPYRKSGFHLDPSHNKTQAFTSPKRIKTEDQRKT